MLTRALAHAARSLTGFLDYEICASATHCAEPHGYFAALGVIVVWPFMYGTSLAGMRTEPSACW